MLNRWLSATGDYAGLAALQLYVVYRALVRALAAALAPQDKRPDGEAACPGPYLRLAERLAATPHAFLILCHGFSGSGKSAASEGLAAHVGAIRISSDVERKRAADAAEHGRACKHAPASDRYMPDAIDANYARLRCLTGQLLEWGYPVIVDATFLNRSHRASFVALAAEHSVPVFIADFHADLDVLLQRLRTRAAARRKAPQASDADEDVLRLQLAQAEPLTSDESRLSVTFNTDVPLATFDAVSFWAALADRLGSARGWLSN